MATEGLDEEMIKNGIQESSTTEIEQEYNSLINELGNDPNKANNARVLRLLYTSFRTASGNDKILRKMYKDLQKKYTDLIKINENLKITQENELKNYEAKSQKYNELLKANIAATEELKQKEKEFNEFTIATRKEEPEIDEGVLQELKITNEQLNNELFETKQRLQENLTKLNKIKDDYEKLTKFKEELTNDISFLEKKKQEEQQLAKNDLETKEKEIKYVKELSEQRKKDFEEREKESIQAKEDLDKKLLELDAMRKKFEAVTNDYKKLGIKKENLLKKIDKVNNEKKIIIEREHE